MSSAQNKNIHNGINFKDSSTTDKDYGASITVAATDTGSGTEDIDITIAQQIAGTMTNVIVVDADGNTQFNNHPVQIKNTTSADLYFKDDDCTDDDVNVSIVVNATATGSAAENADISINQQISGTLTEVILVDADSDLFLKKDTTISNATPSLNFRDTSCTDSDVNVALDINATDTGSGSEDADISIKQQIAGVLTEVVNIDADGDILFAGKNLIIKHATAPALYFKDDNATDDDINAQIDINLTDTGSGAEDADISIKQQIAGTLTEVVAIDADGSFTVNKTIISTGTLSAGSNVTFTGASPVVFPAAAGAGSDGTDITVRGGTSGSGTNKTGGDLTLTSGLGTGNGSAAVSLWVPVLEASGTTTQSTVQRAFDVTPVSSLVSRAQVYGPLRVRTNSPTIDFRDTDCGDGDVNVSIDVNATDTGSGTEDADITISQQIAGTLTEVVKVDADGALEIYKDTTIKHATLPTLNFKDDQCTDDDVNASVTANATATGSGAEDIDVSYKAQKAGTLTEYLVYDASAGSLSVGSTTAFVPFAASQVICDDGNAHGAVNTKIRRYINSTTTGTDITYADSADNGASFTINTAGLYSISYTDFASVAGYHGISVNSAQLTTNIETITTANRLVLTSSTYQGNVSTVYRAAASDVIRCHTDGGPNDTTPTAQFRIIRIG